MRASKLAICPLAPSVISVELQSAGCKPVQRKGFEFQALKFFAILDRIEAWLLGAKPLFR